MPADASAANHLQLYRITRSVVHCNSLSFCTSITSWATDKPQCYLLCASFSVRLVQLSVNISEIQLKRPLAGVLFICMNVDYRILFTPLTDEVIRDGFEFYTTFYNSPPAIKVCSRCLMADCEAELNTLVPLTGSPARCDGLGHRRIGRKAT